MAQSAGILLYRRIIPRSIEVLLVHPGGPFWARKDKGAWSIPKGEYAAGADPWATAQREFEEELGSKPPHASVFALGEALQKGGKRVTAFAVEGDLDPTQIRSNSFEIEWPAGSGIKRSFPEVDEARWFEIAIARDKINPGQLVFLDRLKVALT